jgi:dTMP kinase
LSRKGRIVAIEGVDAVGKRTQSLLLQKWFKSQGLRVASLSYPDYATPIGKEIKAFLGGRREFGPEVRHMLFAANRWEELSVINECKATNDIVIVNRYTESNLAYGMAHGLSLEWLLALEKGIPKSDLVVVLDAPSKSLVTRRPGPKDSYEEDLELQTRVQMIYKELATKFGWTIIDGSRGVRSVHNSITEAVSAGLGARLSATK